MHKASTDVDGLPAVGIEDREEAEGAEAYKEDEEKQFDEPVSVCEAE